MTESIPLVDELVYDVGLHLGEDSAFYLAKGYRVTAFEANGDLVRMCRKRFSTEIAAGSMTIIEGAITSSPDHTVPFYKHPNSVWGTTDDEWVARNLVVGASESVDVPAVNFGDVLRATGMPSFMKIDIEGADKLCLETLGDFEQRPSYVSIESQQADWEALEAEFSLLEKLGYDRFAVVQQAVIPGSELLTRTLDGRPLRFRFDDHASGPFGRDVGPWMSRAEALAKYRRIFLAYRLLGFDSLLRKTKVGRVLRGQAAKYSGRPLPGWFDTHAAHNSTLSASDY